jgi:starch phosphorylase
VTNGVTPRRFVGLANPRLCDVISDAIGDRWLRDLDRLRDLEPFADDAAFQEQWRAVKLANKTELAGYLGGAFDPTALLAAQCKRIHEYKRQHLNVLHVIALWERLRAGGDGDVPRTIVLAGKAAPAYRAAKLIIRLAHGVAEAIAADPRTREHLRLVFVPDFSVKKAQRIYPAADLSEQISTAGMEASGTGNMKFTLNGALTIGTLDGANIEIRDRVGADHFFLFGLTADEVLAKKRDGYRPRDVIERDRELATVLELVASGLFSRGDKDLYAPLLAELVERDPFLVLADFRAYAEAQSRVATAWRDPVQWTRSSILNVARAGYFSSDRSIREYAATIWRIP